MLTIAVLAVMLLLVLAILIYSLRTGISPMPTTPRVTASLLGLIPATPAIERGRIYELGSGWGTLALALARRFPDAQVIGYELSPLPWLVSCGLQKLMRQGNLRLLRSDFLAQPLSDAALVVCYLYPGGMARLRPKLEAELTPGTPVVSNAFAMPGWIPAAQVRASDLHASPLYLYVAGGAAQVADLPTGAQTPMS